MIKGLSNIIGDRYEEVSKYKLLQDKITEANKALMAVSDAFSELIMLRAVQNSKFDLELKKWLKENK